jgi:hypothetical protein
MSESFEEMIKEYSTEYSIYRNRINSFNTIKRIKNIYNKIDKLIKSKCSKEFEKVEELCKRNEMNQFIPLQGKEYEASKALQDLKKCPYNFAYYQKKIKSINDISETILESQMEICLMECSNSDEKSDMCVKNCFFKNHDYTMRAFDDYLNSQLNIIEKQINKY